MNLKVLVLGVCLVTSGVTSGATSGWFVRPAIAREFDRNTASSSSTAAELLADNPEERSPIPVPAPPPPPRETPDNIETPNSIEGGRTKTGWAIVPEVSSLGFGGNLVTRITPNFNARLGINAFGVGLDVEETEFDYEGDLNLFNVSTLIDVHPFRNSGLRISGGLIFNNNNVEGTADISEQVAEELGTVEVSGQLVDASELGVEELATVDADIDLTNTVAPYLGIGGGNPVAASKGWGFWWNLGIAFSGSPEADVSSNVADDVPEPIRTEVEAAADRVLEDEERDLEDELDLIRIYPVLSLGFSYQF